MVLHSEESHAETRHSVLMFKEKSRYRIYILSRMAIFQYELFLRDLGAMRPIVCDTIMGCDNQN